MSARAPGQILSFLVAFLVGGTAIVLLRTAFPEPPWLGVLCAVLAALAAISILGVHYCRSDSSGNLDRAGDNLYYLGFLLTLISLIYALVSLFLFDDSGSSLTERTSILIGSFGIALLSTVFGILGRIILHDWNQGRKAPHEASEYLPSRSEGRNIPYETPQSGYLRSDVAPYGSDMGLHLFIQRLRAEIRNATDAFSHYNRMTMLQAEDTKRHAERMAKEFANTLETIAQDAVDRTGGSYRDLVTQAHATGDAFEERIAEVVGALATVRDQFSSTNHALSDLSTKIEQVLQGMDLLGEAAKTVTTRLDDGTGRIREASETLVRTAHEQRTIMEQSIEFAGVFSTFMEQLGEASRAFAEIPGNMERTRIEINSISESMNAVVSGLHDGTGDLARAGDSLARSAHQQRATIEQNMEVGSALASLSKQLESVNHSLFKVVPQAAGALAALVEQLESTTRSLANFSMEMKQSGQGGTAPDDGRSATSAALPAESAVPSPRRLGPRGSWFRKKN